MTRKALLLFLWKSKKEEKTATKLGPALLRWHFVFMLVETNYFLKIGIMFEMGHDCASPSHLTTTAYPTDRRYCISNSIMAAIPKLIKSSADIMKRLFIYLSDDFYLV